VETPIATVTSFAAALTPTAIEGDSQPNNSQIINELENLALPIDSTESGAPPHDILPFLDLVGDARIVGLGEATHGTSEFVTLRLRMIQLLIDEAGFRNIMLEAPWTGIEAVEQYIQGESDDVDTAQESLSYWMFRNEEFWEFVEWAREFNATVDAADRIHFTGIDPQRSSEAGVKIVLDFVASVDPDNLSVFEDHYEHIRDVAGSSVSRADSQAAYELLGDQRDKYTALSSEDEFEYALHASRVIHQAQQVLAQPITERLEAVKLRGEAMAVNLEWARQRAGHDSRVVLWGHNGHVAKTNPAPWEDVPPLGGLLHEENGNGYVSVGFDFASGSFVARPVDELTDDLTTFAIDSSPADSFARLFEQVDPENFMLDLRDLDYASPAREWLSSPRPMWRIGHSYSPQLKANVIVEVDLPATYDVLVFIRETTEVTPFTTRR
jgi:erythromycin esterase